MVNISFLFNFCCVEGNILRIIGILWHFQNSCRMLNPTGNVGIQYFKLWQMYKMLQTSVYFTFICSFLCVSCVKLLPVIVFRTGIILTLTPTHLPTSLHRRRNGSVMIVEFIRLDVPVQKGFIKQMLEKKQSIRFVLLLLHSI